MVLIRTIMIATIASILVPSLAALSGPVTNTGSTPDLLAVRVGRAETGSEGTIENAVILIEDGKITTVGEDLPIERGIPVLERPDWVVTPGLVSCVSRIGMDSRAGNGFQPQAMASAELYARQRVYKELLEAGVTTLGLQPPGGGIPGQAVAIRPHGDRAAKMIVEDGAYLKVHLQSNAKSKKMLREAFGKVDEHDEKVAKAREKWEKDQEKKKKKKKRSKKDDDEDKAADKDEDGKEDKEEEGDDTFVAPEPDPSVRPFIALRAKELSALIEIRKAGDYLHLLDVIEDEDVLWNLRVTLRNDIDIYEVKDQLAEGDAVVVVEPLVTLTPNTRRMRNIPAELHEAGTKVAFVPRTDTLQGHEQWIEHVGQLMRDGLDRAAAFAGMTLNPARVLGLDERLGSIEEGKDANLVFWSGDPFQPGTKIQAVMLEGEIVFEESDEDN